MDTLASFIGELKVTLEPLVVSGPDGAPPVEPEVPYNSVWRGAPGVMSEQKASVTQEIGEFLIDRLNRQQEPFQGQWLIWRGSPKDLAAGKLKFEIHRTWSDQFYTLNEMAYITIKMPKKPWWTRLASYVRTKLHREPVEETTCCKS
jgi:hypothetical protein